MAARRPGGDSSRPGDPRDGRDDPDADLDHDGDDDDEDGYEDDGDDALDVVEVPITDTLDLHTFQPREVADVVRDYLDAAWEKGLRSLCIIHGRGVGVQRDIVRKVLERDPRVRSFEDAPPEAGGRGATFVKLGDAAG